MIRWPSRSRKAVAALLNATQGSSSCRCSELVCVVAAAAVVVAEVVGLHEPDEDRGRVWDPYRCCGMRK